MQIKPPSKNINISPFEDSSSKESLTFQIIIRSKNLVKKVTSFYKAKQIAFQRKKRIRLLKRELRKGVINLETLGLSNIGIIHIEFLLLFLEHKTLKEIAKILDQDAVTIESLKKDFNFTLHVNFNLSIYDLRKQITEYYKTSNHSRARKRQTSKDIKTKGIIHLDALNIH